MRITVRRSADLENQAPVITDKLLTTREAAVERGRQELDEQGGNRSVYQLNLPLTKLVLPGALVEVQDSSLGESWRGKCVSVSLTVKRGSVSQGLGIERVLS